MASIRQRLDEFYRRLTVSPRAGSADAALAELVRTLDEVEDQLSGIPKKSPPPGPGMGDGRMYPPLTDHTTHRADGGIIARTRGHVIEIEPDGGLVIRNKRTGAEEFRK